MNNEPKVGFVPVEDYLRLPRDNQTYVIEPLIPVGGVALVYGQEKSGKSAIVVQMAAAISGGSESWMGFPIRRHGKVLYLQLDNPRSTWARRFAKLKQHGLKYNSQNLCLADRGCISMNPFNALNPDHVRYLRTMVHDYHNDVVAIVIDTLREAYSGDSDKDSVMRDVVLNLAAVADPAALIIISHSRKPSKDQPLDLMADHRGSSYTTGKADVIIRMTHNKMYYGGRDIEQGSVKLSRREFKGVAPGDGVLMFDLAADESVPAIKKVLADASLGTLRAKARVLADTLSIEEDNAMSRLRRYLKAEQGDVVDPATGEVLETSATPTTVPAGVVVDDGPVPTE